MREKKRALPELLSPAGSMLSLKAAIDGGADAIYLGATSFNARMKAKNFTAEELREGILLAHDYGVKVYIAANTLILDRELDDYLKEAEEVYLSGADAMIIADIGVAAEVKRRIPIELHASTQLSGHNVSIAKKLYAAGFSRMVLAREMPSCDIAEFCKNSPIESEVFVHGALCVCHSGQCLFSSVVGGRSGNRGECAQPCRLPYAAKGKREGYPLSLKDLSLAEHITELCDMGVTSFKIEGRMKSPEYVREVTSVFRELLDDGRNADACEMEYLAKIFGRGGHTDAYFTGKISSAMLGVRSSDEKRESAELPAFEEISKKIPISFFAEIKRGEPSRLTATLGEKTVTVEGAIAEEARTAPISEDTVKKSLSRLGGSSYFASEIKISLEDNVMLPISSLNALRRSAIEELRRGEERSFEDITVISGKNKYLKPSEEREKILSASFFEPENMPSEATEFFNYIYIPLEKYEKRRADRLGVILPEVIFDGERERVKELLRKAYELGARDALVGNIGHIDIARELGYNVHGDIRLNVFNSASAAFFEELGLCDILLSPELTLRQTRDIGGRSGAVIYGRLPLMITEKCVARELAGKNSCEVCENGKILLTDRRGVDFPVLRRFQHRSLIVNSVPIYMADRKKELEAAELLHGHFIFTVESESEIRQTLEAYRSGAAPTLAHRRIK